MIASRGSALALSSVIVDRRKTKAETRLRSGGSCDVLLDRHTAQKFKHPRNNKFNFLVKVTHAFDR